jgi:transglutaminase-like putative cysteine protease
MRLSIRHETRYRYDAPSRYGLQRVRLTPRDGAGQRVRAWSLAVEGGRVETEYDDHHMNRVALVSLAEGPRELLLRAEGVVETEDRAGVVGETVGFAPPWLFRRATPATQQGPGIRRLARGVSGAAQDGGVEALHALMAAISEAVVYEVGATGVDHTAEQALEAGRGVCQDHAHLFTAAARLLGYPARYVSGYLCMDARAEQEATHAWAEAWVAGLGWVGFDVSNGHCPDDRYVRIATGLDYQDAAPTIGLRYGGGAEALSVALHVEQ